MHRLLQVAAAALLLTGAAAARAQITPPGDLIAPTPRNPARKPAALAHNDYQWLWQYAKPAPTGSKPLLLADSRWSTLLADNFRAPQSMWGTGIPLADAARTFLDASGAISSPDDRHVVITGCVPDVNTDPDDTPSPCAQRGMVWADLGALSTREADPLLVFAALRWAEQGKTPTQPDAPYNLWLFPSRAIASDSLPAALRSTLTAWINAPATGTVSAARNCGAVPHINNVLVVDPTGVPHILGALQAGITPPLCNTTGHPL